MDARNVGLLLLTIGALIALVGLIAYWGGLSWFGRLPGDIRYEGDTTKVFVPITSMIVISVVLTLVINLARRFL